MSRTLRSLGAELVRWQRNGLHPVNLVQHADGLFFDCPALGHEHSLLVWFAGRSIPASLEPTARWTVSGSTIDDLTLVPSVNAAVSDPTCWHGWVTNGVAVS